MGHTDYNSHSVHVNCLVNSCYSLWIEEMVLKVKGIQDNRLKWSKGKQAESLKICQKREHQENFGGGGGGMEKKMCFECWI